MAWRRGNALLSSALAPVAGRRRGSSPAAALRESRPCTSPKQRSGADPAGVGGASPEGVKIRGLTPLLAHAAVWTGERCLPGPSPPAAGRRAGSWTLRAGELAMMLTLPAGLQHPGKQALHLPKPHISADAAGRGSAVSALRSPEGDSGSRTTHLLCAGNNERKMPSLLCPLLSAVGQRTAPAPRQMQPALRGAGPASCLDNTVELTP